MTNLTKIGVSLAGMAALAAVASPAAAQYYPQPYPQNNGGGVVGAIVGAVTGQNYAYGQYPQGNYGYGQQDTRYAVQQCAAAVQQRLNASGSYGNRYDQGYGYNSRGYGRVMGINDVQRRSKGQLRVHGYASSGRQMGWNQNRRYGNQGYGNYQGQYGYQSQADLNFSCKVNLQGQITDLRFDPINQGYYRR